MRLARMWRRPLCEVLDLPEWEVRFQLAFAEYEPLPDEWTQTAIVAHASAAPHSKRRLKLDGFQPKRREWKAKPPEPQELENKIMAAFGAVGVAVNRNGGAPSR